MGSKTRRKRLNDPLNDRLKQEIINDKEIYLWMSFCDPDKPKGHQFLGVIMTRCLGFSHAIKKTHDLGINPGGEIQAFEMDPEEVNPEHLDILLSEKDIRKFDYI